LPLKKTNKIHGRKQITTNYIPDQKRQNYLNEDKLTALNNLVEQNLIFAQGQALRRLPMYMKDWIEKLNGFLSLNDREILSHAGSISHELAKENAEKAYSKFIQNQLKQFNDSDFESVIEKIERKSSKK